MDCSEARRILWPPKRLRVVDDDVSAAQLHLRECECCRDYFRQDEALLDLYERVRLIRPPPSVRKRVFDTLAALRMVQDPDPATSTMAARGVGRIGRFAAALGVVLIPLVLVLTMKARETGADAAPSAAFVEDYLRRAVGQERIDSDDPKEIRRFLERELGLRIEPLSVEGFAPFHAEICLLAGRRGAMIVYRGREGDVAHYVVRKERTADRPPSIATRAAGPAMPVVTWARDDVEQALVGEIEADILLDLANASLR